MAGRGALAIALAGARSLFSIARSEPFAAFASTVAGEAATCSLALQTFGSLQFLVGGTFCAGVAVGFSLAR